MTAGAPMSGSRPRSPSGTARLAEHDHEAEPRDVEADRNHVGGNRAIHPLLVIEPAFESAPRLSHLVRWDARRERSIARWPIMN